MVKGKSLIENRHPDFGQSLSLTVLARTRDESSLQFLMLTEFGQNGEGGVSHALNELEDKYVSSKTNRKSIPLYV